MPKFVLYKDATLTEPVATIPIGSAEYDTTREAPHEIGTTGIFWFRLKSGSVSYLSLKNIVSGGSVIPSYPIDETATLYFDGGQLNGVQFRTRDQLMQCTSCTLDAGSTNNGGSWNGSDGFAAVAFTYDGKQYFALMGASRAAGGATGNLMAAFTVNAIGKKSWKNAYDEESHGLNDDDGNSWGGTGENDRSTDNITLPDMPSKLSPFNLSGGRGTHVYVIDSGAFDSLTGYFWGADTSIFTSLWQKWQNLRFNPAAAVLACHALPAAFTPFGDTDINSIYLAGTAIAPIAGYCRAVTSSQFIQYPPNPVYHSLDGLIDFSDFAGVEIIVHVPFCGRCIVPVSACMGGIGYDGEYHSGGISVVYRCDILTGNLCAFILCRDRNGNEACVQTLTGNCAYQIPITGNDSGAGHILGAITSTAVGAVTGNVGAVLSGAAALGFDSAQRNTAIIGNHGGSAGILTNMQCYFEITYTEYSNPANYNEVRGRPADIGGTVGAQNGIDYEGRTVFESADVHGVRCTPEERAEIEALLQEGVYL